MFITKLCLEDVAGTGKWVVMTPLMYRCDGRDIVVPAGFETDLASVPRAFRCYLDDDSPFIRAPSALHDYLYTSPGAFTRKSCDDILYSAMLESGATKIQAGIVYFAVRIFGHKYWRK